MAVSSGEDRNADQDDPERRQSARQRAGEEGLLFDGQPVKPPADIGYRGPTACAAADITYRQLDYWARTGLVEPTVRAAHGSGSQRLYGFRDILVLKVVKRLLDTGVSLQQIRIAVQHLRDRGVNDLAQITLMSDGVSVYECTSPDEVIDLLQGDRACSASRSAGCGRRWRAPSRIFPASARSPTRALQAIITPMSWPADAGLAARGKVGLAADAVRERPRQDRGAEGATSPESLRHPVPHGRGDSGKQVRPPGASHRRCKPPRRGR